MLGVYRDIGVVDILAVNITTPLTHLLNIQPQKSCIAQFGPYKSSNIEWYSEMCDMSGLCMGHRLVGSTYELLHS